MVILTPTSEEDANKQVKEYYSLLKQAFGVSFVPLFFRYIGSFPEYCEYITSQIVTLVNDQKFTQLAQKECEQTRAIEVEFFPKSDDLAKFFANLKISPAYFHFEKDLTHIFSTNAKLVYIFIAMREAVKGWAVAAKKITAKSEYGQPDIAVKGNSPEAFVYEDFLQKDLMEKAVDRRTLSQRQSELVRAGAGELATTLLPTYMRMVKNEYEKLSKTERFLYFRVEMEKIIVSKLELFPHKIESPINIVLELTQKYPAFSELLHLLSDQFPTTAMQRFLFSGWILP